MEETVKQGAIFKKERTEVFIDCKDTMSVSDVDELEGHGGSAIHRIFVATGGAETAMASKRNKFELSAFRTAVHSTTIRRITTVDHLIHVFNDRITWMEYIKHFFIMITKNLLQDIHEIIIEDFEL